MTENLLERFNLPDSVIQKLSNPQWDNAGRVHDWRNHVSTFLQVNWENFSLESKMIIYHMAENQADKEEWD